MKLKIDEFMPINEELKKRLFELLGIIRVKDTIIFDCDFGVFKVEKIEGRIEK